MKGKEGSKKEMKMKTTTKDTTVTVKPVSKNTNIVKSGKEESKKETEMKTTRDKTSATTTITVKVVPKTTRIVREGKEETKAVTKTSNSSIVKIRRPLATKN